MPDVPGIPDVPESEPRGRDELDGGQVRPPKHGDDAGRVAERRDLAHQRRRDGLGPRQPLGERGALAVDQRLHRLESRVEPGRDEVLALADEQPEAVATAPLLKPPDELQTRVGRRGDQASSAAFARRAIFANASGSLTARSASTFRSSSISAFLQPLTNWLYERPS